MRASSEKRSYDARGAQITAKVEIVAINDEPLEDAMVAISDAVTTGKMRVTALQDCAMIAMKADDMAAVPTDITFPHRMNAGDEATQTCLVGDVDNATKRAGGAFANPRAAVGNENVKFVIKTFAEVDGGSVSERRTEVRLA